MTGHRCPHILLRFNVRLGSIEPNSLSLHIGNRPRENQRPPRSQSTKQAEGKGTGSLAPKQRQSHCLWYFLLAKSQSKQLFVDFPLGRWFLCRQRYPRKDARPSPAPTAVKTEAECPQSPPDLGLQPLPTAWRTLENHASTGLR